MPRTGVAKPRLPHVPRGPPHQLVGLHEPVVGEGVMRVARRHPRVEHSVQQRGSAPIKEAPEKQCVVVVVEHGRRGEGVEAKAGEAAVAATPEERGAAPRQVGPEQPPRIRHAEGSHEEPCHALHAMAVPQQEGEQMRVLGTRNTCAPGSGGMGRRTSERPRGRSHTAAQQQPQNGSSVSYARTRIGPDVYHQRTLGHRRGGGQSTVMANTQGAHLQPLSPERAKVDVNVRALELLELFGDDDGRRALADGPVAQDQAHD